jgi:hemerythrin-like domain-containing protein
MRPFTKVHLLKEKKMLPIGPLMIEHRLIERMVKLMADERLKMGEKNDPSMGFLDEAVDFIRTFADRCHHGKEEDILFRDLGSKSLSPEHKKTMEDLVQEHAWARKTVGRLVGAKERFRQGERDGLKEIQACLKELVEFYPAHIAKEDKHFFIPCMSYFTEKEKDEMLQEFWTFDKNLIHEKYKKMVERFERKYE